MKTFSLIRHPMTPLFALRYLFSARPNRMESAMSRKIQFACLFLFLGLLSTPTQSGFAQNAGAADPPLSFGNNFFVTGDYVVAGAKGMNVNIANGFATGTFTIPDGNPGVRGTTSVPKGAQIVGALLYWQTAEKSSVMPGQPDSGQNGFFRPLFTGGPQAPGYAISGVNLPSHSTVSFSNGGCSGGSTGKIVRTYRADVRSFLPRDANGNVLVDSADGVTFEVRLPSSSNTTPITLGSTLVLIFRVISPNFPLNSIVIYDGAFAASATTTLTMSQPVQGFYQAATTPSANVPNPVSRLTHIVGSGQSNKFQTVFLNGAQNGIQRAPVQLPSLYGNGQPAFPGYYGNWDNPTWKFPDPNFPKLANPLQENDDSATTSVSPTASQQGCVSWGAVIVSTTVHDDDKDGILQAWKQNQGYTDVGTGQFVSLADPDPNNLAKPGQQDVFIQLDHVIDSTENEDFTPKPGVESAVKAAFLAHNIHLHIADKYAVQETACTDASIAPLLCPYPNQPGVTTFPDGFEFVKNQLVDPNGNTGPCTTVPPPANCTSRFPLAERNSHHYAIFGDALGGVNWALLGGTLTDSTGTGAGVVAQSGHTVTFYTARGHGLTVSNSSGNGRVTITGAITNPSLNGTYLVTSFTCPTNPVTNPPTGLPDCSIDNKALGPYIFTIQVGGNPTVFSYKLATDPNLAVASGQAGTGSGVSYIGGGDTLVTLGLWGSKNTAQAQEGTFMHELGHTLGLTHGGYYYDHLAANQNPPDYRPTIGENCKSMYQTVMNYMFQTDLLGTNGGLDFSSQRLNVLNEDGHLGPITTMGIGVPIAFPTTSWYDTKQTLVGSTATHHCDGTPLSSTDPPTYFYEGGTTPFPGAGELDIPWSSTMLDANFDGTIQTTDFQGYNDWANIDLRQVGASGSILLGPGGLFTGPGGLFTGPGGLFTGPGGLFTGPGGFFTGPGGLFTGPGGLFTGPGGLFTGPGKPSISGGEIDLRTTLSVTHRPNNPTATENASPRVIHLSWTPPLYRDSFNVYRSADNGHTFSLITNTANTFFDDTVNCNPTGYQYFVTTVLTVGVPKPQESVPSNTVSTGQNGQLLTGCYTFTGFSAPAAGSSAVQGALVPITWLVQDFSNKNGAFVSNSSANTVVAIGPINNDAVCVSPAANTPRTTIALKGAGITFNPATNQFSFNWNTIGFAPGCYLLELDLDSGQPAFGGQPASAFQVLIYLSDVSLTVSTTSLPNANEGIAYNAILSETGGVVGGPVPFTWTVISGSLPPNIILGVAPDGMSGLLSGTPTTPGTYNFTVKVTDSIGDFGMQALSLLVNAVVTNTLDSGAGSLRRAILDVNAAQPGPQPIGILFNIPAAGVQTITPTTPLPALAQPTFLDATTQPGFAGTPLVELNGGSAGALSVNGIHITAGSSTVRGLVIDSFSGNGILIDTNGGDVIQGNYVGTDPTGTSAMPNLGNGIQIIDTPNNVIGGTTSSARNIISGNTGEGVRIDGALATGNVVQGNYIGTNVSGSAAVGNNASGVYIRRAPGNSVIGNTVSGNVGFAGITICGSITFCGGGDNSGPGTPGNSASGNIVQGNFVGTNPAGTTALGNNQAGVSIDGAPNTQVGGTTAALHNIISFNGTNDVRIFDAGAGGNQIQGNTIQGKTAATTVGISVDASLIGNTLTQNSISGHGGLGIDLSPSGPGGGNNFPVITSAQFAGGTTTIMGTLNSTANATFTIEFFSNQACNASGNGEGAVFLGSIFVQTNGSGNAGFVFMVAGPAVGNSITSTSTDAFGTTSEFSACAPVS